MNDIFPFHMILLYQILQKMYPLSIELFAFLVIWSSKQNTNELS